MVKQHLKRINAPREWPIPKKSTVFVPRPLPGAHNIHTGMPLVIILRDLLQHAKTKVEVKKIIQTKEVLVDGKKVKETRHITGLMDVISLPTIKESYRIIIDKKGKLAVIKIDEKEANTKLCRVNTKKMEKGKIKLGLHDGRSLITDKKEIATGDTLVLNVPKQEIKDVIKTEKGNTAYLIKGRYKGEIGKIEEVSDKVLVNINGKQLTVTKNSVFIIGKDKPVINM